MPYTKIGDTRRKSSKTRLMSVIRRPYFRTSVLHLGIGLPHLSIVEDYLRALVRPLGRALAFPC